MPAASRLTLRARKNRRRRSLWSRVPRPRAVADACGRAVRRSLPALAATAAITLVGSSVWLGYRFVTTSERFAITAIEIHGEDHLTEDQIRAALPVRLGDNMFATKLDTVTRALRAGPWIASAEAHRVLPHTLVVEIRERASAAIVDLGELYLVDTSGHPFKRAQLEAGDGEGLPVITGIDRAAYEQDPDATAAIVTRALATLTAWRRVETRPTIGELHVDPHHAVTLRTYDHAAAIRLGPLDAELASRMQTFDAAWAELSDVERARIREIHVGASAPPRALPATALASLGARPDHVTIALHPVALSKD